MHPDKSLMRFKDSTTLEELGVVGSMVGTMWSGLVALLRYGRYNSTAFGKVLSVGLGCSDLVGKKRLD